MDAETLVRDVEQDPRVGDVVQWHPMLRDEPLPALITIIEITDDRINWVRSGEVWSTTRAFWRGERIRGGPRGRLELIRGADDGR